MKKIILLLLLTTIVLAQTEPFNFAIPAEQPVLTAVVGLDWDGTNIYAALQNTNEIMVLDLTGTVQLIFGGEGDTNGKFAAITDVAVDSLGNIYGVDFTNSHVDKFNSAGTFIGWAGFCDGGINCNLVDSRSDNFACTYTTCTCGGGPCIGAVADGTGDGQFFNPTKMYIDDADTIYIADSVNERVQIFTSTGTYSSQFGTAGTGNGQFDGPTEIVVDDNDGDIYVVDSGNHRVQRFNSVGVYQSQFGIAGAGDGQFSSPVGITLDQTTGDIYVGDTGNNRVQRFNNAETFQGCIAGGIPGEQSPCTTFTAGKAFSQFNTPQAVEFLTNTIIVADTGNDRIQEFQEITGIFQQKLGIFGTLNGEFDFPTDVAVDITTGFVYVVDQSNHRIQKFNTLGIFLLTWGTEGSDTGEFSFPVSITVDGNGDVHVTDEGNSRIQKFDSDGNFITAYDNTGGLPCPWGIEYNTALGEIHVTDECNEEAQVFDTSGNFIFSYGTSGSGDGEFSTPQGVAVDTTGDVYIVDNGNSRVQRFSPAGTYEAQFGTFGTADGQFSNPKGIDVASDGDIFVSDTDNGVQVFDSTFTFLNRFGETQTGKISVETGEFNEPFGIEIYNPVFIADAGNNQIDQFQAPEEEAETKQVLFNLAMAHNMLFSKVQDLLHIAKDLMFQLEMKTIENLLTNYPCEDQPASFWFPANEDPYGKLNEIDSMIQLLINSLNEGMTLNPTAFGSPGPDTTTAQLQIDQAEIELLSGNFRTAFDCKCLAYRESLLGFTETATCNII